MVQGYVHIRGLFYTEDRKGRVIAKFYEDGYSSVRDLDNDNQIEMAYQDAIRNAGHKYAYHSQQRYDDVEYKYDLLKSEIIYTNGEKQKAPISRKRKAVLRKQLLEQVSESREENKNRDIFVNEQEYQSMFKGKKKPKGNIKIAVNRDKVEQSRSRQNTKSIKRPVKRRKR